MSTESFIEVLTKQKKGAMGLLRTHSGQGLDESLEGFDLFTGIWWPLRQTNERAPRREVAWLVAKLYAFRQLPHSTGDMLARQIRHCQPMEELEAARYQRRFDRMLALPLAQIEPALRWAFKQIASARLGMDWVALTDDLSMWEKKNTRKKWAKQYLKN